MKNTRILNRSIATLLALAPFATHGAQQSITAAGDPTVNATPVRWPTDANWSGAGGALKPAAADNAVINNTSATAVGVDIRASGFAPAGATAIQDLSFAGAGAGAVTLENNSTGSSMVLTLNGGRGTGVPIIQTGTYAVTIPSVGAGTTTTLTLLLTASRDISVGAGGATIGAAISQTGTQSINKTGTGRLTLSGVNLFSGGATTTAGILEAASNGALGTGAAILNGGTLEINVAAATLTASSITVNVGGQIATRGAVTLNNAVTLNGGILATRTADTGVYAGAVNVTAPSSTNLRSYTTPTSDLNITISGLLSGASALTINGNATNATSGKALILTNPANTFSGGFNVSANQTLRSAPAATGNTLSTSVVNLNGGTLQLRDDGAGSGGTLAYGNNVTATGASAIDVDHVAANTGNTFSLGTLSLAGTMTVSGANSYGVRFGATTLTGAATLNATTATATLASIASSAFSLTKTGAGNLVLPGANLHSGVTHVDGGTLTLTGSLASTPRIDVKAAATFDVTGVGGGFTLGGTQILSGAGTVNGAVTVASGGRIEAGDAGGAGTLTVSNLTLGTAPGNTATLVVSPSATVLGINVTSPAGLVANGGPGKVTINIGGSNPTIGVHQLVAYSGALGGGFGSYVLGTLPTPRLAATLQNSGTSIDLNVTGIDAPFWSGRNGTQWSLGANNNWGLNAPLGPLTNFLTSDSVTFSDGVIGATADVSAADVAPSAILFNNASQAYTVTGTKAIIGTTGLTKTGAAKTTITNTNSFTGAVSVSGAGMLSVPAVADSGSNSPLGAGTTITLDDGTLEFTGLTPGATNRPIALGVALGGTLSAAPLAATVKYTGFVSGGGLTKTGAGTVILTTATNTYTTTLISAGTLQIGDGVTNGTLGSATTITDNATLAFNNPLAQTVTTEITGSGTLTKTGAGQLVLSGAVANSYLGSTTVRGGNLILSKTSGVNAIGGDLFVEAGGTVSYGTTGGQLQDHIPDTANIILNGGTFGSGAGNTEAAPTQGVSETVASVTIASGRFLTGRPVSSATPTPFIVTGAFAMNGGSALIQRGAGLTADQVVIATPGPLDLDGGSNTPGNESHLTVGLGGLVLSGATINFNAGPSPLVAASVGSIVTLNGNVTSLGTSAFARLNPTVARAIVDLAAGVRTIDVTGTLTVAADVGATTDLATAGIVKEGTGKLVLEGAQTYASLTSDAGRTDVLKAIGTGTSTVTANAGTINFATSQTLASITIADGAVVNVGLPFSAALAFVGGDAGVAAVPEPGSAALLLGGLVTLLGKRRRSARS